MRNVCGLDVHKDSLFMCILKEDGVKIEEKFGALTPDLDRLRDLLVFHSVGEVAMESTSIYWIPIWRVLSADFDVKLVNPHFIKQLPEHKTDVQDAHWIATILQKELVKGSFIPTPNIQELRQYERKIFYLNRNLLRAEQSIDLILQRCHINCEIFAIYVPFLHIPPDKHDQCNHTFRFHKTSQDFVSSPFLLTLLGINLFICFITWYNITIYLRI